MQALGAYSSGIGSVLASDEMSIADDFTRTIGLLRSAADAVCAIEGGTLDAAAAEGTARCIRRGSQDRAFVPNDARPQDASGYSSTGS